METSVLLTKEQYLGMQDVDLPNEPDLQEAAFKAYVESHRRLALERFFFGHKEEAWFLERYIGDEFEGEKMVLLERYGSFLENFADGKFNELSLNASKLHLELNKADDSDICNIPLSIKLPEAMESATIDRHTDVLAIGSIPPSVKKASIESLLRDASDTFVSLYIGEPVAEKNFNRSGFAVFQEGTDLNSLVMKLENVLVEGNKIYYTVQKSFTRQIKLVSSEFSAEERVAMDLDLSSRLLDAVCTRYGLEPVPWTVESDQVKRLDLNISCLRKVFSICYYTGTRCSDQLDLFKNCGDLCLRAESPIGSSPSSLNPKIEDLIRLYGPAFELSSEDGFIERKYVAKLEEARFRCSLCSKLFKGPEFVIKHIHLKHEEETAAALQQLSLLNFFLERPSPCALMKSSVARRRPSVHSRPSPPMPASRPPPEDADTRALRRPVRQYTDWDAPAHGEVEISYD